MESSNKILDHIISLGLNQFLIKQSRFFKQKSQKQEEKLLIIAIINVGVKIAKYYHQKVKIYFSIVLIIRIFTVDNGCQQQIILFSFDY